MKLSHGGISQEPTETKTRRFPDDCFGSSQKASVSTW